MDLKRKLEYHYRYFDKSQISPDPLEFLHRFESETDIEAAGILASVFAYGRVEQIISTLNRIFDVISPGPSEFIGNYNPKKDYKYFRNIRHRFYTEQDIAALFSILHRAYCGYGSLRNLFLLYYFDNEQNLKESISCFSNNLLHLVHPEGEERLTPGLEFMFPDPRKGSACKRMNLFLRWMIRKDELDFGLWPDIPRSKLVIPVDTHIARICLDLKLTKKKNVSWAMAEEITEKLKKFDAEDPVKYDFAICHIGMRGMKF